MRIALSVGAALWCVVIACHPPPEIAVDRRAAPAALDPTPVDRDGDGHPDGNDHCPTAPEDSDGIEDADGCPEDDADDDRIRDEDDACPLQPGGVLAKDRGCPNVLPAQKECLPIGVPIEVHFEPGAARLEASERDLLAIMARDVAALSAEYSLYVIGRRATTEPIDRGLERAEAVRLALIEGGLASERIHLVNRADRDAAGVTDDNHRVAFRLTADCASEAPFDYAFQAPMPAQTLAADAPAMRYANLSPVACRAELKRRKLPVQRDRRPTPGVATGVRFTEPLNEVTIVAPGKPTTYGVMDCRLALTFDEATAVLAQYGVARIRIDNTYRRGATLPGRRRGRSQHAHGLAADITAFYLEDGRELQVEQDWDGERGDPVCGPRAFLAHPTENTIMLRDITCELARRGLFHTMLTPNFDAAHRNHFHFDIKRGAKRWDIH